MSWTRENVLPVVAAEREAYHAEARYVEAASLAVVRSIVGLDEAGESARAIIEELRRQALIAGAVAETRARAAAGAEAARHTAKWIASVKVGTQIDITKLLADDDLVELLSVKSEEFVGLIKNLTEDMAYRINREVLGSILEGRSNADIAAKLREIEGVGRARARLIARDQASKLNASMNEFRQGQAGVTHYKWKTILDGRERATHHARNGHVYEWSKPPPGTGHPGNEINCRCRALAVLEEYDS